VVRAIQWMPLFHNPMNASEGIVKTVNTS
jgi:hypothetical protein